MSYGEDKGAKGWLVGEPNKGLSYMFTMMNMARHAVGVQGVAIAERAYQQALAFANERVQGVPEGQSAEGRATIIHHPDVRRMLLMMKSQIEAMRALAFFWSSSFDKSNHSEDEDERKSQLDGGEVAKALIATMGEVDEALGEQTGKEFADIRASLAQGIDDLKEATDWLLETGGESPELALASAVPYLRLWGTVAGGWMMAQGAVACAKRNADDDSNAKFNDTKIMTARFYAMHILPQAAGYAETVRTGADSVLALAVENF